MDVGLIATTFRVVRHATALDPTVVPARTLVFVGLEDVGPRPDREESSVHLVSVGTEALARFPIGALFRLHLEPIDESALKEGH